MLQIAIPPKFASKTRHISWQSIYVLNQANKQPDKISAYPNAPILRLPTALPHFIEANCRGALVVTCSDPISELFQTRSRLDQPLGFQCDQIFINSLWRIFETCPVPLGSNTNTLGRQVELRC